jgi:myo-inositol 2-dehydrogenase/D-chiro-inositol 1-dehydrogenase
MPTFALAGSGRMASVWAHAIAQLPGHQVTQVASRDAARARARAEEVGARSCAYDDLPGGADVVVVATPPALHADQALAAVRAGAGVIVEKPLATTLLDADRLVAAAEGGARIAYAENLLFSPYVREAVSRARQLGSFVHLEARSLQSRPTWGDFLTEGWGGGVLFDLGVHPLAVVLAAAGDERPVAVRARLEGADDHPTDEWAELWLTFASGLRARVEASWRSGSPVWDLQAASAHSAVRLELLPEPHVEQLGVDLPHPRRRYDAEPSHLERFGYLDQVVELGMELTSGSQPYVDAHFGRYVLDIVCAAYASARTGEAEALPFAGPRDRTPLELWRGA